MIVWGMPRDVKGFHWRSDKLPRPCSGKLPRPFTARDAAIAENVTLERESGYLLEVSTSFQSWAGGRRRRTAG